MIVLYNPLSTTPGKQPLPLSVLSLAAVLEHPPAHAGRAPEPWALVDGNLVRDVRRRVRNFERVLNAVYPTITDPRLTGWRRGVLRAAGAWRYAMKWYGAPLELRALQRIMRYQRPETTGF